MSRHNVQVIITHWLNLIERLDGESRKIAEDGLERALFWSQTRNANACESCEIRNGPDTRIVLSDVGGTDVLPCEAD